MENSISPQSVPEPLAPLPLPPLPPLVGYGGYYPPPYLNYYGTRPARPRVWTVFVAFLVALAGGLGAGTIVIFIVLAAGHQVTFGSTEELQEKIGELVSQPLVLLSSGVGTQLMLLATALSAALLSPVRPVSRRLRLNASTLSPIGWIVAGIGALAVNFLFAAVVGLLQIKESGTLKVFSDTFRQLTPAEVVFAIFVVGLMPGFAEEFLFRGYMQTRLVLRWGRWIGIPITAVLFGVMHVDLMQGSFAAAFGIYLGLLAEQAGSIRPTMFCHMLNNSIGVLIGRYAGGEGGSGGDMSLHQYAIMAAITATVLAGCILYITLVVRPSARAATANPLPVPIA